MSLTRSLISRQHRPILDQLLVRLSLRQGQAGRKRLELVRELLAIRRRERLPGARFGGAHVADSGLVMSHWRMGSGTTLSLAANLSDHDLAASPAANGTPTWGRALREGMPAWSVRWQIG